MRTKGLTRISLACLGLCVSALAAAQGVRFSELHYDDSGTDEGEAIEVSGPAGLDVTGWRVVLYNGSTELVYDSDPLSGVIPATCGVRGVMVVSYPTNGIQNGSPDGLALLDAGGTVREFLSYEGVMTAIDGPAIGLTSTDILVNETDTRAEGTSVARRPNGTWATSARNSFGACNDDDPTQPAEIVSVTLAPSSGALNIGATLALAPTVLDAGGQPVSAALTWTSSDPAIASVDGNGVVTAHASGDVTITATAANGVAGTAAIHVNPGPPTSTSPVRFNEIHYDNVGVDSGEAIEIEGPAGTDVTGFRIVLYNGNGAAPYNTQTLSGALPASCDARGVLFVSYPQDGIQNGAPDGMALFDAAGGLIEFRSYEGVITALNGDAAGATSVDIGEAQASAAPGTSLQRTSSGSWQVSGRELRCLQSGYAHRWQCGVDQWPQRIRCALAGGIPGSAVRAAVGWQQPDASERLRVDVGDSGHRQHRAERRADGPGRRLCRVACHRGRRHQQHHHAAHARRGRQHHGDLRRQRGVR